MSGCMRKLILCLAVVFAACGGSSNEKQPPQCNPLAEGSHALKCTVGVDTTCSGVDHETCSCGCDGYWECDLVLEICDAGAPDLKERD